MFDEEKGGGWNHTHGTVEHHLSIDSFTLLQHMEDGFARVIEWENGGILLKLVGEQFTIAYDDGAYEKGRQVLRLSKVENGFGGRPRTYFLCPGCERRVRKLYRIFGRFCCRVCGRLNYSSQQLTRNERVWVLRMKRILAKDFNITEPLAPMEMYRLMPKRPKWMRKEKYDQGLEKLRFAQAKYIEESLKAMNRLLDELGK